MKIYIVQAGGYSDTHIVAMCLDEADARKIAYECDKENSYNSPAWVNEYDTDDYKIIDDGMKRYFAICYLSDLDLDNLVIKECDVVYSLISGTDSFFDRSRAIKPNVVFGFRTRDEDHAKKIAYDKFAEWKAKKEGVSLC